MTARGPLQSGIHADVPSVDYHADEITQRPSLSAGIAKLLITASPLHAWTAHPRLNPDHQREEEAKFDLGTVAHLLLLEGDRFTSRVEVIDAGDWRTKAAKEARDQARENDRVPLLVKDWARALELVEAIHLQIGERDDDPPLFANGQPERTLIWEEDGGVVCRARLDWLHDDFRAIDDLKTTSGSANPHDWCRRTFWSIGCDVQSAFYLRGLRKLTDKTAVWRYAIVESQPPYALSVVTPAASALALGAQKVDYAINVWRRCLETGEFPGYPSEVAHVDIDAWQEADFLQRTWTPEAVEA